MERSAPILHQIFPLNLSSVLLPNRPPEVLKQNREVSTASDSFYCRFSFIGFVLTLQWLHSQAIDNLVARISAFGTAASSALESLNADFPSKTFKVCCRSLIQPDNSVSCFGCHPFVRNMIKELFLYSEPEDVVSGNRAIRFAARGYFTKAATLRKLIKVSVDLFSNPGASILITDPIQSIYALHTFMSWEVNVLRFQVYAEIMKMTKKPLKVKCSLMRKYLFCEWNFARTCFEF